ncbi:MAG: Lrp/AsnC family transcriptional regulator [Nitrososphaerota archaeon]|nr:Lrp/AsnC family transcriptional regulator [Candidatus Bathyarchaeota archaeon]MDW8048301.1 Lrp/AsnC family transcriptional regulator [Nitrososphaerota archaeon]
MDSIDYEILKILKKDARIKYVTIAKIVGLSEGAVRRRIKKMLQERVIRRFTIETPLGFEGIVLIRTEPTRTKDVVAKLRKIADKVFEVSGSHDIAVFIQADTMEDLNRKIDDIRRIPAVLNTNTLIKLKD